MVRVRALMDTGADDIFVDKKILGDTECPTVQSLGVIKSVHKTTVHIMRQARIAIIGGPGAIFEAPVVSAQIQDGTKAYDAVFGTSFLEMGRLVIEPEAESQFTFHADKSSPPPVLPDDEELGSRNGADVARCSRPRPRQAQRTRIADN